MQSSSLQEDSPLLVKSGNSNTNVYSQHTFDTLAISDRSDSDESLVNSISYQAEDVLGSIVVFETTIKEGTTEGEPEDASTLMEGVVEEVQDVAETILENLHQADEGDMHYLEMGLIRNMSILPGDIVDAASSQPPPYSQLPTTQDPDNLKEGNKQEESTNKPPLSAYLLLLSAVISLSSIGPLLELQHDVSSTMKLFWRMAGASMLLFPLAFLDVYRHGFPPLTTPQWITFLLSTVSYDVLTLAFVMALSYTAVGNAVILSNSLAMILLAGKLCVGDPVTFLEGAGAMVAFGGAALCSKDAANNNIVQDDSSPSMDSYLGDALAILSAVGGVGYLIFAKTARQHMSLYVFMFLTMFVGCGMILVFQTLVLGERVTLDCDPNHGIGGFLVANQPDRLPLEVAMVIVCNLFGTMGYVRAMQYFDNLVISSAALLEPVVAEFMAFSFGVGRLPGWQGWLGNALVACGTFAVIYKDGEKDAGGSLN
jgi:drug/metabolite transporter (DMT)-like permease